MEVRFYLELAPQLVELCPAVADFLPAFYAGRYAGEREFLVLEDLVASGYHAPNKTQTLRSELTPMKVMEQVDEKE